MDTCLYGRAREMDRNFIPDLGNEREEIRIRNLELLAADFGLTGLV
jgi:hypothetical protein